MNTKKKSRNLNK